MMKKGPEEDIDFYRTSKFDVILIVIVLLFSTASILWISRSRSQESSGPKVALIYQGDRLLEEVDLEKDRIITLPNGEMQIGVKGARIKVIKSNCPRQICINMGGIQHNGQTIVCVPNKVLIEIESTDSPFLDAICY